MFEQLNKQVIDLREQLQHKDELLEEEQELYEQLADDAHEYICGPRHEAEHKQLSELVNEVYDKYSGKHSDLGAILNKMKEILQKIEGQK